MPWCSCMFLRERNFQNHRLCANRRTTRTSGGSLAQCWLVSAPCSVPATSSVYLRLALWFPRPSGASSEESCCWKWNRLFLGHCRVGWRTWGWNQLRSRECRCWLCWLSMDPTRESNVIAFVLQYRHLESLWECDWKMNNICMWRKCFSSLPLFHQGYPRNCNLRVEDGGIWGTLVEKIAFTMKVTHQHFDVHILFCLI